VTGHCAAFATLSDGARLSFAVRGDVSSAVPILLNRPLGGSMDLWGTFADHLAVSFPLILFDPRGVGCSSPAPLRHSTRAMARDAIELLDALEVARAHVFGLSLGGMVASWIAVDAPQRVSRLVLAATLPASFFVTQRVFVELIRLGVCLLKPGVSAEVALVHGILSLEFYHGHPERIRAIDNSLAAHPTSPRDLVALTVAALRHDARACLPHVRAPTLLLLGDRDPIVGMHAEHELLIDIPHASLVVIPGAGHDISLERPELAAARIIEFLES
jgi:3-oxoadipate enol-lactonase